MAIVNSSGSFILRMIASATFIAGVASSASVRDPRSGLPLRRGMRHNVVCNIIDDLLQLVSNIKASGNEVTFLVVNKEEDTFFKAKGIPITAALLDIKGKLNMHQQHSIGLHS